MSRKKKGPASRPYEAGLYERLADPRYAVEYLNSLLEENDPELLLLGLRDVAKALGFARLAADTGLSRESLYKALSKGKNPRIGTVLGVLTAMGCRIRLEPSRGAKKAA